MNDIYRSLSTFILSCAICVPCFSGPTTVEGDVSGIWDVAGSPYYVISECKIKQGNTLEIQPGVEVVIAQGESIKIQGKIEAIGQPDQPIVFRAVSDIHTWKQILVEGKGKTPPISEFHYCHFQNAEIALHLYIMGQEYEKVTSFQTIVSSCYFASTVDTAIYGSARGGTHEQHMTPRRLHSKLVSTIQNNIFKARSYGICIHAEGGGYNYFGNGNGSPTVTNNVFMDAEIAAFMYEIAPHSSGSPQFINNTIINCNQGINVPHPYDCTIKNNIFFGTETAVGRTGEKSGIVSHNCFFNNVSNFEGYPSGYGDATIINDNQTPCDFYFNIFEDPQILSHLDYHLTDISPCIEAGTKDDYTPLIDIDCDVRPQYEKVDIGADEFNPSNPIGKFIDIKANNSDGPVTVSSEENVRIAISLYPGNLEGSNVDMWIVEEIHGSFFPIYLSYVNVYPAGWRVGIAPMLQIPLTNIEREIFLDEPLPTGKYTFYFVVDDNMDGFADGTWSDSVTVIVE
ncbi:MAG: hypothetical protein JXM79_03805 [Sedimentisphaerales bacterium]|nr:hypothetical protein [Sedimentisphaerales bacterium]